MRFLRTNTAIRLTVGPFFDKTDGVTPETALTVTNDHLTLMVDNANVPELVLDASATASGGNNDMVHVTGDDAGFYDLELTAAQTNYLGRAMLAITDAANHCPVFHEFMILPANVYDAMVLGTAVLAANASQLGGTNQTGRDLGLSVLLSVGTGTGQVNLASGKVPATVAAADVSGNVASDLKAITAGVDFSATMKTALNAATPASVTGAVGAMRKNVAFPNFSFPMVDSSNALKTGLTVTCSIRKDAAASFSTMAGSVAEIGTTGWYTVDWAQAETNAACIGFMATAAGANPTTLTIITQL
jgi:hypothetical protein